MKANLNNIVAKNVRQVLKEYTSSYDDGAYKYQGQAKSSKERRERAARLASFRLHKGLPYDKNDFNRQKKTSAYDDASSYGTNKHSNNSKEAKLQELSDMIGAWIKKNSKINWEKDESDGFDEIFAVIQEMQELCQRNGNIKRGYRVSDTSSNPSAY